MKQNDKTFLAKSRKKPFGKRLCIFLMVVFTLVMAADMANLFLTPAQRGFGPGGLNGGDFQMPQDGELPSFEGGQMTSFDGGEIPAFEGGQMPPFEGRPGGSRGGSQGGILQTARSFWLPILLVCVLGNAVCLIVLIRIRRRERAAAFGGVSGMPPLMEEEEEDDAPPRRKRGPWGAILCLVVAFALILAMIPAENGDASSANVQSQVISGIAEAAQIHTVLSGAGTLEADNLTPVTVPQQVTVLQYHVRNGETVAAGDPLVSVDKTSASSAMMDLYDVLDDLDDDLEAQRQASNAAYIYSTAAGRVKKIYAAAGDTVTDVLYEHGALMLLSLDGTMKVTFQSSEDLTVGDAVTVKYAAISEEGRIASVREGRVTVTLPDENAWYGAQASILDEDGKTLGEGEIKISSALKVIGYYGKVEDIPVAEGDMVSVGTTLINLKDTGFTTDYQILLARRNELENQMQKLSQLARTGVVYAENDGIVSGVPDDAEIELLSSSGSSWQLVLLSNAVSDGENQELSDDGIDQIDDDPGEGGTDGEETDGEETGGEETGDASDGGTQTPLSGYYAASLLAPATSNKLLISLYPTALVDYTTANLAALKGQMNQSDAFDFVFDNNPVTLYVDMVEQAQGLKLDELNTGELLVVYFDQDTIQKIVLAQRTTEKEQEKPSENMGGMPGGFGGGGMPSGVGGFSGGMPASGGTAQQASYDAYIAEESELLYVSDQEEITATFSADELDVLTAAVGLEAQVTLDAMKGQSFPGRIVRISNEGTNDGGNTKYLITVAMSRKSGMLDGMNASVKVVTATRAAAVTIPASALVEEDGKTCVYTTYDEETDTLGGLAEVVTGASDEELVEILSGLEAGDPYYYRYADTVVYSFLSRV